MLLHSLLSCVFIITSNRANWITLTLQTQSDEFKEATTVVMYGKIARYFDLVSMAMLCMMQIPEERAYLTAPYFWKMSHWTMRYSYSDSMNCNDGLCTIHMSKNDKAMGDVLWISWLVTWSQGWRLTSHLIDQEDIHKKSMILAINKRIRIQP